MQPLLLATRNPHKTREFAEILGRRFPVNDLSAWPDMPEVVETGRSFAENAILKAVAVSRFAAEKSPSDAAAVVADDSGLEVDSLGGAPGIFSARYAGDRATDQQNIGKLLRALAGKEDRQARFRCVIALAREGEPVRTFEGVIAGRIVDSPRGRGGFGYDPVFQPAGLDKTFAELPAEEKNRLSHRARAIHALVQYLDAASY